MQNKAQVDVNKGGLVVRKGNVTNVENLKSIAIGSSLM